MKESSTMPGIAKIPHLGFSLVRLLRSQWWDSHAIRKYQESRLAEILRYAVDNVPHYSDLGLCADDIQSAHDLQKFPVLTKQTIQEEGSRMRSREYSRSQLMSSVTSGSSGEPTKTWFDPDTWLLCKFALKFRRTLLGGFPIGQRLFIFSDATLRHDTAQQPRKINRVVYSELHMPLQVEFPEQFEWLSGYSPSMIYGPPSVVKALCDFALENDLSLPVVKTIFLSAEYISEDVRATIEHAFSGRVIGVYGSTEFKEVAWQCTAGRYHSNFESVYIECIRRDDEAEHRLLITTLVNKAMPLIRFDIGDYATLGNGRCACGRESPYLNDILGRQVEFLELSNGRRVSPYVLTTNIETVPQIRRYQIVQHSNQSIELRVAFYANAELIQDKKAALLEILKRLAGDDIECCVTAVSEIKRPASGKFKIVTRE